MSDRNPGINKKFTSVDYSVDRLGPRKAGDDPKASLPYGISSVADLAEINRIADRLLEDEFDGRAQKLIEAWRQGALTATAMLEKEEATIQ